MVDQTIVQAIEQASRRPDVQQVMAAFYARVDREIAGQPGTCWNRSECCHFESYGHRLYVTTLEAAYFLAVQQDHPTGPDGSCPHAVAGRCTAREPRPLGCRVFFCDPLAADWQGPLTEQRLAELRQMHTELRVPYAYLEWLTVLRAVPVDRVIATNPGHRRSSMTSLTVRQQDFTGKPPRRPADDQEKTP
jgi:hypothetical protein